MDIEKELERAIEKHRGKAVGTFQIRIDLMAEDCLKEIRSLKQKNLYLLANLKLADDPCTGTCSTCGGQLREGYTFCPYCGEFAKDGE